MQRSIVSILAKVHSEEISGDGIDGPSPPCPTINSTEDSRLTWLRIVLSLSLYVFSFSVSGSNNNFKYILKLLNALTSPHLQLAQQHRHLPLEWCEVDGPSWHRRGCLGSAHVGGSRLGPEQWPRAGGSRLCVAVGGNEGWEGKRSRERNIWREKLRLGIKL